MTSRRSTRKRITRDMEGSDTDDDLHVSDMEEEDEGDDEQEDSDEDHSDGAFDEAMRFVYFMNINSSYRMYSCERN